MRAGVRIEACSGPAGTTRRPDVPHHLGVDMGESLSYLGGRDRRTFEDTWLGEICREAFSEPKGERRMESAALGARLEAWAAPIATSSSEA